jgi:hypothetical protein
MSNMLGSGRPGHAMVRKRSQTRMVSMCCCISGSAEQVTIFTPGHEAIAVNSGRACFVLVTAFGLWLVQHEMLPRCLFAGWQAKRQLEVLASANQP